MSASRAILAFYESPEVKGLENGLEWKWGFEARSEGAVMGQLVISGLDPQVLSVLGVRAASHGRTVEGEARQILTEAIGTPCGTAWAGVDTIRERLAASNRNFGDSVELLREDRGR